MSRFLSQNKKIHVDTLYVTGYIQFMIKSIRNKALKLFFEKGDSSKIQPAHRKRIQLILTLLDAAVGITDLNFPGSNLHRLKGDFSEYWSIAVSGNWRVIFEFKDNDVFNVDYLDYH